MKESAFQFTNPELKKVVFSVFDEFKSDSPSVKLKTSIEAKVSPFDVGERESNALVEVTVRIGDNDSTQPFYIEATEGARFKWENEAYSQETINNLLRKNGTALLVSYLRPVISHITGFSRFPAYQLPYIDLTDEDSK